MFTRPAPRMLRRWLPLLLSALLLPAAGRAVAPDATSSSNDPLAPTDVAKKDVDKVVLDTYEEESAYVGSTTFREKEFRGPEQRSFGSFDESQFSVDYSHRFQLVGKVYLKLGVDYERFDFGTTNAPLPTSLQSLTGTVALEYIVQGEVGAFIESTPGIYYSDINSVGLGNVDAPTSVGGIVPLGKKFYLLVGVRYSALSHYPFYPILGAIYVFNTHLRIEARPPTPRIIYSYSKKLDFYAGAELLGAAYKRDDNVDARPQDRRFNNGVIDMSETRVGGGITYSPTDQIDIDLDSGYAISRDFEYYRGDGSKTFKAHPAPYLRIAVTAEF